MPMVVDLPAPFGPSRPKTSPSRTSSDSPSTARVDPKVFRMSRRVSTGVVAYRLVRMDLTWFILSSIAGIFGAAYFIYGKKQAQPIALLAGALLVVLPYFIDNITVLVVVCLALMAAPFVIRWEI